MPNLNLINHTLPEAIAGQLPVMAIPMNEAIRISGFSRSTIYGHLKSGNLIGFKSGRTLLIDAASLQRCVASLPRATFAPSTQSEAA